MSRGEEAAKRAADEFRHQYRLGIQPLGDLVAVVENTIGCDVAVLEAPGDEHGLTVRDPVTGTVFIGVLRSDRPMRQRSSLAHELGHLVSDDWENGEQLSSSDPREVRANAFARHLLIPEEGLREFLGERADATLKDLSDVVQHFLVSPAIAVIAMRESGYISAEAAAEWKRESSRALATRFGWTDQYKSLQEASNRTRAPQTLLARSVRGYVEGVVGAQTIASLRQVPVEQVVAELKEAGVVPLVFDSYEVSADSLGAEPIDFSDFPETPGEEWRP